MRVIGIKIEHHFLLGTMSRFHNKKASKNRGFNQIVERYITLQ